VGALDAEIAGQGDVDAGRAAADAGVAMDQQPRRRARMGVSYLIGEGDDPLHMLGARPIRLDLIDVLEAQEQGRAGVRLLAVDRRFRRQRIKDAQEMGRTEFRDDGADAVQRPDPDLEAPRGHARASSASRSAIAGMASAATLAKAKRRKES